MAFDHALVLRLAESHWPLAAQSGGTPGLALPGTITAAGSKRNRALTGETTRLGTQIPTARSIGFAIQTERVNCREVSDDDFWKERKKFEKTGNVHAGSRDFYEYGQIKNAEGAVVAKYVQISIDDPAREFIFQMRRQTAPIPKATAAFFGISAVLGTGGGLLYYAVIPFLAPTVITLGLQTTTSAAVDFSALSIQQLNTMIRGTQKQLLNKLFGQGMQGAQRALASGEVPAGLTRQTLMVYREI